MPSLAPIKQKDLIRNLRKLGWEGPFSGGKHPQMQNGSRTLTVPNPHRGDISIPLLRRILRQAEISIEDWQKL
ncbi:MAG: type II toxin-antitoxin system HicA family toxin [Pyrinomonadaceae bacterium]|nr:type II toxin-antitoxin system HicA family toxin [Pyrinomonadaceae bacterium]